MTLSAAQIEIQDFTTTKLRTGYDMDEVDNFLDDVVRWARDMEAALEAEKAESARLRSKLAEANLKAAVQPEQPAQAAGRVLEAAQKAADEIIREARAEALGIVNQATAEADARKQKVMADTYQAEVRLKELQKEKEALRGHLEKFVQQTLSGL